MCLTPITRTSIDLVSEWLILPSILWRKHNSRFLHTHKSSPLSFYVRSISTELPHVPQDRHDCFVSLCFLPHVSSRETPRSGAGDTKTRYRHDRKKMQSISVYYQLHHRAVEFSVLIFRMINFPLIMTHSHTLRPAAPASNKPKQIINNVLLYFILD